MRRTIRAGALIVFCAAVFWAVWLLAAGGFDTALFGVRIRSNNPRRVVLLAVIALGAYVLTGGRIPLARARRGCRTAALALGRRPGWIAAATAATATIVAGVNSTAIAGGSDVYGYVSQAELWLTRDLKVEQPWVARMPFPNAASIFAPLGYRPTEGEPAIVPTYSPGLPMLLAAAKAVGGQCTMFAVVPLALGLAVMTTYGLGCRLGSAGAGAIAAWFVATSPIALEVAVEALTDVPVMAAWPLAFYFALRPAPWNAVAAGVCAGAAILVRPNLVPLAIPLCLWMVVRRDGGSARDRIGRAALFACAALPGIVGVAWINQHLYGSAWSSGYGNLADGFALSHIVPNVRRFLGWIAATHTPVALVGIAALVIPLRPVWPGVHDRRVFAIIVMFLGLLWAQYSAYLEFESAGYLRFLLPGWPFMMLGVAAVLLWFARVGGAVTRPLVALAVVLLGIWALHTAVRRDVFEQRQAARHAAPLGSLVRTHTNPNSVILAVHRSGSLRYYGGRVTARYDMLDPAWLDRFVGWLNERGVRVYALLDGGEAAEAKARFASQRLASRFDRPVLLYAPAGVGLYDLSGPPTTSGSPIVISETPHDRAGCDPPVAPPAPLVIGEPQQLHARSAAGISSQSSPLIRKKRNAAIPSAFADGDITRYFITRE